jgi:hypothetical protein
MSDPIVFIFSVASQSAMAAITHNAFFRLKRGNAIFAQSKRKHVSKETSTRKQKHRIDEVPAEIDPRLSQHTNVSYSCCAADTSAAGIVAVKAD